MWNTANRAERPIIYRTRWPDLRLMCQTPGRVGEQAAGNNWRVLRSNSALQAVVSLVKGGTGQMVGRSISVKWLSTLFPLVTFMAKYRHFHN